MFGIWPSLIDLGYRDLVAAAEACDDPASTSNITRLRRRWPAPLVRGAVDLALARRKAIAKFEHPERLVADPVGVEQATSSDVAVHKARRFAALGMDRVFDLCCGIGGDAMALAGVAGITVVDIDPARTWMARHNVAQYAGCHPVGIAADVTTLNLPASPFHIDPARRTGSGRRMHRFGDARPGAEFVRALIQRAKDGAVKLSPGVDLETLPPGEVEIINRNGTLVQAVLWTGRLARDLDLRTATRLPGGMTLTGPPGLPIPSTEPGRYLLSIDPAVERAGLIGLLCGQQHLAAVHPALGLLTAEEPVASPWLTPFELIEALPWRDRKVRAWLRAHDAGEVVVKTRGGIIDPDIVARRLRGKGTQTFTVFVLRIEKKVVAWITRRKSGER